MSIDLVQDQFRREPRVFRRRGPGKRRQRLPRLVQLDHIVLIPGLPSPGHSQYLDGKIEIVEPTAEHLVLDRGEKPHRSIPAPLNSRHPARRRGDDAVDEGAGSDDHFDGETGFS